MGEEHRFGDLLRRYREAAGLTQEDLAERANLGPTTIRALERGRRSAPRPDTVRLLAAALALGEHDRAALLASARPAAPAAPSASAGGPRHNLPAALSSFVGREREQAAVRELLGSARAVTLVGGGGMGKTRLALAAAEGLLDAYPDGVWLAELAPLADAALVPGAVAQALGLQEEPGRPLLRTLAAHLEGKRLLLVLDNCEHLVAACAELAAALLRSAPRLQILATSREGLGVAGEVRYQVPPLGAPDPRHLPALDVVGGAAAVQLFVERARERRPDFALSAGNARAVAEICARLDGSPLAIELAAARVGSLAVEGIAARLDDRFRLLTGGRRGALPRQQTLRAALDWSYDLLREPEQVLLRRVAVFAGGWALEAAEAVCTGRGVAEWEVLDLLDGLVAKSLVQVDDPGEGAVRYRLLETVRQYEAERLAGAGEEGASRDRHLRWCLALAEEAALALKGAEPGPWLDRLEAEHDNLRAALAWCAGDEGGATPGLRLAGALCDFWRIRGHWAEGRRWVAAALAREGDDPQARLLALAGQARLAAGQWDLPEARRAQEARLALAREVGDAAGIQAALRGLAAALVPDPAEHARAAALAEEALALARAGGDARGIADGLGTLAQVANYRGEPARAAPLLEEGLAHYRALGDRLRSAHTQLNLAICLRRLGERQRAQELNEALLPLLEGLGDANVVAVVHHELGGLAFERGDHAEAISHLRISLRSFWDLGNRGALAEALEHIAAVAAARDRPAEAVRLLGVADALLRAIGMPPDDYAQFVPNLAQVRELLGERGYAAALAEGQALPIGQAVDEAEALSDTLSQDRGARGSAITRDARTGDPPS